MKISDINAFIDFLKSIKKNKIYVSEEFINWNILNFQIPEIESNEIFEENKKKITKRIIDYINLCKSKFILSEFQMDEFDEDVLINTKFSEGRDQKVNIEYKLEWRHKFYELLKKINWREFELLGKLILLENHIENVKITRSQKDQGIDFYGYFSFKSNNSHPRFYNYFKFRILGQVKHSEKNNGVDYQKVASFGTEINKLRKSNNTKYFENLDQDFINSKLPILGVFITNSYYPTKAVDFANEYGIIYWDGEQISQDLASKEIIDKLIDEVSQDLSLERLKELIIEISK